MAQASRKTIDKKLHNKITSQLYSLLCEQEEEAVAKKILDELLSEDEHLMLAKRAAIVALLCRGYSGYKIAKVLHVSPQTVMLIRKKAAKGELRAFEKIFGKMPLEEKWVPHNGEILKELNNILSLGGMLPPYVGSRHARKQYG